MKNISLFESFIESAISLIPQQAARFIAYSLLTIGLVQASRLVKRKIIKDKQF